MEWFPHTTVATIVEQDGRFLMVEEDDTGRRVFNQPAGHLEDRESLLTAALRETLEETGWHVELTGFLGIYHYRTPSGTSYIRHCFTASPIYCEKNPQLDDGIIAAHWLDADTINAPDFPVRSVAVRRVLHDYMQRPALPLDVIYHQDENHHG